MLLQQHILFPTDYADEQTTGNAVLIPQLRAHAPGPRGHPTSLTESSHRLHSSKLPHSTPSTKIRLNWKDTGPYSLMQQLAETGWLVCRSVSSASSVTEDKVTLQQAI